MKNILSSTALAAALLLGGHGFASAQSTQSSQMRGTASPMSEEQLKNTLRERGYTEIEDIRRDGQMFRISQARRYGETVDNLRVDVSTGQVRNEDRLSEDQVNNMLEERGYYDVENVERDGFTYTADAKQRVRLRVDGQSGSISRERTREDD
ncbi:hypothetical protein HB662_28170 [Roseomonas frigidaquae]|uniref:PepSY domain-containing protein n=1 Tax=Falsiroseomonas frigidaquae TaxID=487318 RepID=A0ABX1F8M2_9PROT|nr:PepSY domain-containing protein [Falsiroseomonas frigidaquae]NKE48675.1 hypothetical protein [Falsiroseomonas frigidaquae]